MTFPNILCREMKYASPLTAQKPWGIKRNFLGWKTKNLSLTVYHHPSPYLLQILPLSTISKHEYVSYCKKHDAALW